MTTTLTRASAHTRLSYSDSPTLRLLSRPRRQDGPVAQSTKLKESPSPSRVALPFQPSLAQNAVKPSPSAIQTVDSLPRAKKTPSSGVTIECSDLDAPHSSPSPCACPLTSKGERCARHHDYTHTRIRTLSPGDEPAVPITIPSTTATKVKHAPSRGAVPVLPSIIDEHQMYVHPPSLPPLTMHPMVRTKARRPRRRTPRSNLDVENQPPTSTNATKVTAHAAKTRVAVTRTPPSPARPARDPRLCAS
ncbi:hypothetical protein C8Q80DRAFT_1167072 [Daedaleopsis nitida]|nr:hypothetical protein C8Q80DRAFT_1167072 [Daedaleopsis nitida]